MARRRGRSGGRVLGAVLAFLIGAMVIGAIGQQVSTPGPDALGRPVVDGIVGFLTVVWGIAVLVASFGGGRSRRRRTSRRRYR
jgi:hypothetical protein